MANYAETWAYFPREPLFHLFIKKLSAALRQRKPFMKLLHIVPVLLLLLATSAYCANRYLDDEEIDRLQRRFNEQRQRREQGIIDHPNNLSLVELDDLSFHYEHKRDPDYNHWILTELDPNNDLPYYILESGIRVPKSYGWCAVLCGFMCWFYGFGWFIFFAAFFALLEDSYNCLAMYCIYGGFPASIIQFILCRLS